MMDWDNIKEMISFLLCYILLPIFIYMVVMALIIGIFKGYGGII